MRRVLHVIDSLHLGGAQEVVMNLVLGGDRTRYSHEVATLHGQGVYWERMKESGIRVHSLSPHKFLPAYLLTLPALLQRGKFDVLHCHLVASNILAKPLGHLWGVPVILNHDHNNDPYRAEQSVRLALDVFSNRFASHLITVSDSCTRFLIDREKLSPDKVTLIQNAIDLQKFSPTEAGRVNARKALGLPEKGAVIAGVGRLNPQKNFSLFIQIAAKVLQRHPEAHFILVGEGPELSLLKNQVKECGLEQSVQFLGYLKDTRQAYAAADILVMPSLFEGLPMTLLEAMAMRVPVVASALDGMAEVIENGVDGFLEASGQVEGFSQRVIQLIETPELAAKVGLAASQKILQKFSSERMCREVEQIYDRLLR